MADNDNNNPIRVLQCGRVKAAIWADSKVMDNTVVKVHSIKIDRSYKDGEKWKHTNAFYTEDLPKVAIVASEAYKFIRLRSSDQSNADESAMEEQE
ncbi:MAG: hypothetical protein ACYTEK_17025 [Planctomycetota bacterium]|jgi:hypothetical protein